MPDEHDADAEQQAGRGRQAEHEGVLGENDDARRVGEFDWTTSNSGLPSAPDEPASAIASSATAFATSAAISGRPTRR